MLFIYLISSSFLFFFFSFVFYVVIIFLAAATELILAQKLQSRPGVIIPITADIYNPVLDRIQSVGVTWTDTITKY